MSFLIRGIKKLTQTEAPAKTVVKEAMIKETAAGGGANVEPLLKRVFMFLEDGDWKSADEYCERVLDIDPENVRAYIGKTLVTIKCVSLEQACQLGFDLGMVREFNRALQFSDGGEREELQSICENARRNLKLIQLIDVVNKICIKKRKEERRIENIYRQAQKDMSEKKYLSAAKLFESIKQYLDSAELAEECYPKVEKMKALIMKKRENCRRWNISCEKHRVIGLKADGTVVAVGDNHFRQCDVSEWTDIVAISAGRLHTAGLKADGTVVATGDNKYGKCDVFEWADIVAISVEECHTIGLKADGTVAAVGNDEDGQCNVSEWTDIVAISTGGLHTVGLKADGTVVAVGSWMYLECDVSEWTDIVAISAGAFYTVGLKADGTVVAVGNDEDGQCNVSEWTDIVEISTGGYHTVGLKADGTVVATGNNEYGKCDVFEWADIVEISTGGYYTVGLKADGTVVAVGNCGDVSKWTDIVVPDLSGAKERLRKVKEKKRIEQEKERIEQEKERERKLVELEKIKADLQSELANLKGLFTGKRRKELTEYLSEIEREIQKL